MIRPTTICGSPTPASSPNISASMNGARTDSMPPATTTNNAIDANIYLLSVQPLPVRRRRSSINSRRGIRLLMLALPLLPAAAIVLRIWAATTASVEAAWRSFTDDRRRLLALPAEGPAKASASMPTASNAAPNVRMIGRFMIALCPVPAVVAAAAGLRRPPSRAYFAPFLTSVPRPPSLPSSEPPDLPFAGATSSASASAPSRMTRVRLAQTCPALLPLHTSA